MSDSKKPVTRTRELGERAVVVLLLGALVAAVVLGVTKTIGEDNTVRLVGVAVGLIVMVVRSNRVGGVIGVLGAAELLGQVVDSGGLGG